MIKIPFRKPRPALSILLALIAVYALGGYAVARHLGQADNFSFILYYETVMLFTGTVIFTFIVVRVWTIMLLQRPRHLTRTILDDLHRRLFSAEKLQAMVPLFIGFIVLMSAFTSLKTLIPLMSPYHWDDTLIHLDRVLHGGHDPWRLLQPLLGHGWITQKINYVYNFWFFILLGVLYWQIYDLRRPDLRMQFFWTFFLIWIVVGTILATYFSSMGPCFYSHVMKGPNPFADQMKYLIDLNKVMPIWAISTQDLVWDSYKASELGLGMGISAMPSVHVAIATLFFLVAWPYGKWMRVFFGLFWACIMVGSVHLAWHYAVDGYFSTLITIAMWFIVGWFFRNASKDAATGRSTADLRGSSE
ncbi:MAG: hypothetical protein JWO78_1676 [Micavibrio sp.]|nr:hypothetical protein [Micavibrio sp.]